MSRKKIFNKTIRLTEESHKLLKEEAHKKRTKAQEVLDQLIKDYIGLCKYDPAKKIPKLLTTDIKLEGDVKAIFIFSKDNFELLERRFLGFLNAVKKSEVSFYLILNDIEGMNIEMNLRRSNFCYGMNRCCNYQFTKKTFRSIDTIDPGRKTNIYNHFEYGLKKRKYYKEGPYYNLDKINTGLLPEEDIQLIKTKTNNEGEILESDLIEILAKYKNIDTSYISSDFMARDFTAEDLTKEEIKYQNIIPGDKILDNKRKSTRFDDIIKNLERYKTSFTQKDFWGVCMDDEEIKRFLTSYGCTEEEIGLLKDKLRKYPFDNTLEFETLQYIRELVMIHNCKVKAKVEPFREIWHKTGEHEILNVVNKQKEYLYFNYDDIRNSLILSGEEDA